MNENRNDTASAPMEPLTAEQLRYLERDRWPEFERELYKRRPRLARFTFCQHSMEERPRWSWMICRCRTWAEVERVLNRHQVQRQRERGEIVMEGMRIYRCR